MIVWTVLGAWGISAPQVRVYYKDVEEIPSSGLQKGTMSTWQIAVRPGKVTDLRKKMLDAHTLRLSWQEKDDNDGFWVYRKSGGQSSYRLIAKVKKCRYTDRDLKLNKTYRYRIVPVLRFQGKLYRGGSAGISYCYRSVVRADHQKYTYSEMTRDMKLLVSRYPGRIQYQSIGNSQDGREIYDIILGNRYASKKLLVVGAIHAREYMTSLLCMRQIEYYLENYYGELEHKSVKQILQNVAIHFVPMANPDGVTISQSGIRAIRSASLRRGLVKISEGSTAVWKANARGVDLNRNFPVAFKKAGKRGAQGFTGKKAASECETRALIQLLAVLKKSGLRGVINYHATGSIIFGDYEGSGSVAAETARMYELARSLTGYSSAAGYHSSSNGRGNLREYILYRQEIPCITVEIGRQSCPGPISEFPSIWRSNSALVLQEAGLFE